MVFAVPALESLYFGLCVSLKQNKHRVAVVSFFGAMVTVIKKVQSNKIKVQTEQNQ